MTETTAPQALSGQLTEFVLDRLGDPEAEVAAVAPTSGHAGFSYTFEVRSEGQTTPYFLRLPPAGVKLRGTADVLRQVCALRALDHTDAPHARVVWSGEDPRWFGMPYFVTEWVEGTTFDVEERVQALSEEELRTVARAAIEGLVAIRATPWQRTCGYLGDPIELSDRIAHWDRFYERAADRELLLAQAPGVRAELLRSIPKNVHVGLCHGDYQFGNLMYGPGPDRSLRAIVDWELCSVGPTLRDLGWIVAFHDRPAWGPAVRPMAQRLTASELLAHWPDELDATDLPWFEALALYEYAVISGFNLMLHRRGKRPDATWEWRSSSAPSNLARASELLAAI
jgi:aminoglycoside phosphotransferase (APT) family kinase protein